jgi:hypothetical protein
MTTRDIVILANSRRHDGHCVAGKDIANGEWLRPINILGRGKARIDQAAFLDEDFRTLGLNVSGPQLLDCVRIGLGSDCALYYQPENKFIDGNPWEKTGRFSSRRISELIDIAEHCFLRDSDTHHAYIPANELVTTPPSMSLNFLHLTRRSNNVELIHTTNMRNKPQHRMKFDYGSKNYNLAITDYRYENLVAQSVNDDARIFDDFYMTIGLGEKFSPRDTNLELHYRFIVGIIPTYGL